MSMMTDPWPLPKDKGLRTSPAQGVLKKAQGVYQTPFLIIIMTLYVKWTAIFVRRDAQDFGKLGFSDLRG